MNKQLLPIAGRPLVVRVIDQLVAAGIADVLMIIDERHASDFLRTLRDGTEFPVSARNSMTMFTARSRSSAGNGFLDTMSPSFPQRSQPPRTRASPPGQYNPALA
jgi:hypothetical protein